MIVTAALPAPGAADTTSIYRLTTNNLLYFSDGSNWYSAGGIPPPTTALISSDFSWYNQGGASVSAINGGTYLSIPATATTQFRGRTKAKTAPYTITAQVLPLFYPGNYVRTGLFFTDGTKVAVFGLGFNTALLGSYTLFSSTFTDATTIFGDYISFPYQSIGPSMFLRIADDSTNRICSYSMDGTNWVIAASIIRTDFLTATSVGFGGDWENNVAGGMLVLSWIET